MSDFRMEDVEYGIDGGYEGIYDGVIAWVMKDGRVLNRFRGEGSRREALTEEFIGRMSTQTAVS